MMFPRVPNTSRWTHSAGRGVFASRGRTGPVLVPPARLELPLLDPRCARDLGAVAANLLDEALGVPRRTIMAYAYVVPVA
jgi:hypothetical protein